MDPAQVTVLRLLAESDEEVSDRRTPLHNRPVWQIDLGIVRIQDTALGVGSSQICCAAKCSSKTAWAPGYFFRSGSFISAANIPPIMVLQRHPSLFELKSTERT
jgi:hypothetical protein